jgi:predicted phage terminase large subunit-like protein
MVEGIDFGSMTAQELKLLYDNVHLLPEEDQIQVLAVTQELERRAHARRCRDDLLEFCKHMDPSYIVAAHHKKLADLLVDIAFGIKDRVAVSIPPRHGKSHLVSTLYPAWFLGKFPDKKVLMASHTGDLAVDFGRKVRNLIASPAYQQIFPGVSLAQDSKSAGRWNTNHGGEYFACGVGASIAGRGADLLLVDDPHSEQDLLAGNFDTLEKAYNWFTFGARTRLMSGGRIAVIHTRWHQDDLIGHLVADGVKNPKADQYEVFEFPAILDIEDKETGEYIQKALWPEKFDLDALERTKASMPAYQWNAQYMQSPTAEEAAIVKREWWRPWKADKPPQCDYVIMALDAAAEKHNRADFTALLTFGVFSDDHWTDGASHLILLNAINVRVEFPELKELAYREYADWEPDAFIVEKKSAGTQLYQELRRAGVSVQEFTPSKNTGDKVARMNAIADILRSGMVWYPEGRRWAEDVIEQCVAFPYGSHDDMVDCVSMALARFRQGGFIELPTDWRDPPTMYRPRARAYY